jgi:hypothetical protein
MTRIRFGPYERELLREQALAIWSRAEDLARHAEVAQRRSGEITATTADLLARSVSAVPLTHLVNRAIFRWGEPFGDAQALDEGIVLVASAHMGEQMRIQELLRSRFSKAVGASDAGTALGLAIAVQPEYAVIDAELELGSGVDLALTLPTYAPKTKALVLTDDPQRAGDVRLVGLDAERRFAPDSALLAWVDVVAA